MKHAPRAIKLVDPAERLELRLEGATFYYRRLSLGARAELERRETVWLPDPGGGPDRPVIPRAALEGAILGYALLGWRGVLGLDGRPAPFSRENSTRLPARVREFIVEKAQRLHGAKGEEQDG